jgi:hypothetical protein
MVLGGLALRDRGSRGPGGSWATNRREHVDVHLCPLGAPRDPRAQERQDDHRQIRLNSGACSGLPLAVRFPSVSHWGATGSCGPGGSWTHKEEKTNMPESTSARSARRAILALGLVLLVSLLGAASASAAVTATKITAPSDPFYVLARGQNVTISGTATQTGTGNTVDIACYLDNGTSGSSVYTVASGVTVSSAGSFTATVPVYAIDRGSPSSSGTCRLRAVPSGTPPTSGLAAFAGPRTVVTDANYSFLHCCSGPIYDFNINARQLSGQNELNSFGRGGLDNSYLVDPQIFGQLDVQAFYFNDKVANPTASNADRPGVLVDGDPAYPPAQADDIHAGASGLPVVALSPVSQNPSNGDLTVRETEPLAFCSPGKATFPPTSGTSCTSFVSAGVELQRTITTSDNGHIVTLDDSYKSTDGASHAVNLLLENEQDLESYSGSGPVPSDVYYQVPGESTFAPHASGTVTATGGAPASVLAENHGVPDGSTAGARVAITYGQAPSGPLAFTNNPPDEAPTATSTFDIPNSFTVPAGGSVPIRYAYSTEYTLAAAEHDAAVEEDVFKAPAISIASPSPNSTVKSTPVAVSGLATAGSGVKSVTVNGVTATVSGESYSVSVPLNAGKNTLKAVITSNGGATASASETVTYTKANKPKPNKVSDKVTPHADHKAPYRYKASGSISRPKGISARAGCTGSVRLTVKHGRKTLVSRKLKVSKKCKFSRKVSFRRKHLKGHGKLRFSFRFLGNRSLAARSGRTITVRFG